MASSVAVNVQGALYAPDLPWNTYRADELGATIMGFVEEHEPFFKWWAQVWFENFQFLFGNHNVKWSKKYGMAVDYDFLRQGGAGARMTSQTNITRVVVEALASLIYSNLPEWEVEAMDDSQLKGKRFKKICQKLLDCYMTRLCMDKEFATAALQYVLFGQMAFRIDWNYSTGSLLEIPRTRKVQGALNSTYMAPNPFTGGLLESPTPLTDERGQPIMEERWEAVVDDMGRQIVDKIAAGDAFIRALTPLQYRRAIGSTGTHKTRYMQEFRLMDYDEFLEEYKDVPGATKNFKQVRPIYANADIYNMAIRHFMRMQFTTPPTSDDFGRRGAGGIFKSSMFKHKVFVVEHFDQPSNDRGWPEGRRVVVCNGEATHITKPSYSVPGKLGGWHPFAEAQWMNVAPSSIAPGPINDVVRKNKELNVKDGLQATALRRNMGSQLLVKTGSGIDPNRLTGEPGLAHEVSDPFGARWLHDDMPIPPVVAQLRAQDKDDVYEVSGAGDALRGQGSDDNSTSGYQQKIREDQEEKRLAPARKNFEGAVSEAGEKLYFCVKSNTIKMPDEVMGFLKRSGAGEFTAQDVIAFLTTPVSFGVEIRVRKSSMALKSKATQQATLMELAGGPLAQRLGQDAKVLDKFLKFFDAPTLRDSSAPHRDRAERENEVFLDLLRLGPDAEGLQKPIVMFEDDDEIHGAEHTEFAVTYAEELLKNEWLLLLFLEHVEHHRLQSQEKAGDQMPGTSLQTGNMMAVARQQAAPTVQTIQQNTMMKAAQPQQQPQQQPAPAGQGKQPGAAPQGQRQAPQAPKLPGGRTNPQAPSANTPTAASKGGFQ